LFCICTCFVCVGGVATVWLRIEQDRLVLDELTMTLGEVVLNSLPCRDFLFAARWCGPDKEHFAGFASLDCRGEASLRQVEEAMAFSTLITDSIFINFTEDHRYKMFQNCVQKLSALSVSKKPPSPAGYQRCFFLLSF
jgi:hypothetical protein